MSVFELVCAIGWAANVFTVVLVFWKMDKDDYQPAEADHSNIALAATCGAAVPWLLTLVVAAAIVVEYRSGGKS